MTDHLTVNRYLKDRAMDHIDHALGRPLDPMARTNYRNHFATDKDGGLASLLQISPHWREGRPSGDMAFFAVTNDGRRALRDHLKEIADPHRAFEVRFAGHTSVIVAKTAAAARYSYWARLSDALPDLKFNQFLRRARVSAVGARVDA